MRGWSNGKRMASGIYLSSKSELTEAMQKHYYKLASLRARIGPAFSQFLLHQNASHCSVLWLLCCSFNQGKTVASVLYGLLGTKIVRT